MGVDANRIVSLLSCRRRGIVPRIQERTVKMSNKLFLELHDRFNSEGYIILRGIVPTQMTLDLQRFVEARFVFNQQVWFNETQTALSDPFAVRAWLTKENNMHSAPSHLRHLARGELPLEDRLNESLRQIAHIPAVIDVLCKLLECESIKMHNPPSIRVSQPHATYGNVPMHQDWVYNTHVQNFITLWLPLCQIDDFCGGVDVLVGSQERGPVEHQRGDLWSNEICDSTVYDNYKSKHIILDIGDILLFGPHLMHRSHHNTSRRVRFSIDYRFFDSNAYTSKHSYDPTLKLVIPPQNKSL